MEFYTKQHQYYCGIDLHTKKMTVCILKSTGEIVAHRNLNTNPETFLNFIAPFRISTLNPGPAPPALWQPGRPLRTVSR